jgi:hypothetical protein
LSQPDSLEKLRGRVADPTLNQMLQRVQMLAANSKSDVLGALSNRLSPLITGAATQLLTANGGVTLEDLLQKPGLIRFGLPVAKYPMVAPVVGRLALANFTQTVLSPDCNRDIFKLAA